MAESANMKATVEVGKFLELLLLTTQWYHVPDEHFTFHKVAKGHYSGEVKSVQRLGSKFIRETIHQILSQSQGFLRTYYKQYFGPFLPYTYVINV